MDYCEVAVFIFFGVIAHGLGDFLTHRFREGKLFFLHCFLYTLFFIPQFLYFQLDLSWLLFIYISHWFIDLPWTWEFLAWVAKKSIKFRIATGKKEKDNFIHLIVFGIDQLLHLLVIGLVALNLLN